MRTVSIFVASSMIEFEYERIYIGNFIRKYNDNFKPIGNRVRLHMCEDEYRNSQSFYDRLIEASDIFILMIGEKLGDFSKHELVDVADKCSNIKKKVIVLNSEESRQDIPLELESNVDIKVLGEDKKDSLQTIISDLIEEVIALKEDEPSQFVEDNFILSLPCAEDIEVAVLNNIVRRLNDQDINIVVHDDTYDGSENACVGLLTKSLFSERERLLEISSKIIKPDDLWIFADEYYNVNEYTKNADNTTKELGLLLNKLITHYRSYPSFYSSIKNLALDFEVRLRRALHAVKTAEHAAERAAFIYVLEDHWLIQKSLISGRKTLRYNLWNITADYSVEKALRKERVICNLLNIYWLSGQWDKHVDAWTKLNQGKFDELFYEESDLEEIKSKEYNQALFDFVCDKIERIQKKSVDNGWEWLDAEVKNLLSLIDNKRSLSNVETTTCLIYFAAAYTTYDETIAEALNLYERALNSDAEHFKNIVKTHIGGLVYIGIKLVNSCNLKLLREISIIGQKATDESDLYYYSIFKLFECVCLQQQGEQEWEQIIQQLKRRLSNHTLFFDNSITEIYLLLQINIIQNALQKNENILNYVEQINEIFENYWKYLSNDELKYGYILMAAQSFLSLANLDISLIIQVIDRYTTNGNLPNGKFYYDLLFNKATIYSRLREFEFAIETFHELTKLYKNDYDIGSSFQNIAWCSMQLFKSKGKLQEAEQYYLKALSHYRKFGDKRMCGNVYDGLSFCYILQKRFMEAETAALNSIAIHEYQDDNKYCNYISSLLCQGKYIKAISIYHKYPCKKQLLMLIKNDWNNEINQVGIGYSKYKMFRFLTHFV